MVIWDDNFNKQRECEKKITVNNFGRIKRFSRPY